MLVYFTKHSAGFNRFRFPNFRYAKISSIKQSATLALATKNIYIYIYIYIYIDREREREKERERDRERERRERERKKQREKVVITKTVDCVLETLQIFKI